MILVLTQPIKQAIRLAEALVSYQTKVLPLTSIEALAVNTEELLTCLRNADIIICTSPSVIDLLPERLPAEALTAIWCAPGTGTASSIYKRFAVEALYPESQQNSEALIDMMILKQVAGKKVLLLTGVGGRTYIENMLSLRQAQVRRIELYERKDTLNCGSIAHCCTSDFLWLISSAETLARLHSCDTTNKAALLVTSQRLVQLAEDCGYNCLVAASNKPADIATILDKYGRYTAIGSAI